MAFFANQKTIIINREIVQRRTGKNSPYLIAYQENLKYAMRTLSGTGFKVYMMLVFNINKYRLDFSPKYVSLETGISMDSARKALKELEEEGFLVKENKNLYYFYERPEKLGEKERSLSDESSLSTLTELLGKLIEQEVDKRTHY